MWPGCSHTRALEVTYARAQVMSLAHICVASIPVASPEFEFDSLRRAVVALPLLFTRADLWIAAHYAALKEE
jgi:hypothetical protein